MSEQETGLTFVDGRDALAYLTIRPNATGDGVTIEAAANGTSKQQAAFVLRHVARQWAGTDHDGHWRDLVFAYVSAVEGSDECAQAWHEMEAAVRHYEAVQRRDEAEAVSGGA